MFHDLLSSRLIQGGFAFFVLCVGGSLLYSWHIHRTTEVSEFGKRPQPVVSPLKNKALTSTAPVDFQTEGVVNTPDENTDTPISDATEALPNETEFADIANAFLPDDFVSEEEAPAEDVPVSPYGFGPYPELPEGWSLNTFPAASAEHELQKRVRIKLIGQGVNVVGTSMEDGLVYPIIKGTAYVQWKSYWRPTGKVTYISRMIAHPEDHRHLSTIKAEKGRDFTEADVPSDIKLVSFEDGAIDPYEFLDLP
ncbi:hypothetical protein F4054_07360 [Candidatus Poribacteria bacterium]|nr:hypothetical protein [Candidatus Poribacteria bacterium]MYK22061.1 hypothetical protein [Candidatus Poribacteria bacterium]